MLLAQYYDVCWFKPRVRWFLCLLKQAVFVYEELAGNWVMVTLVRHKFQLDTSIILHIYTYISYMYRNLALRKHNSII